jgi:hypothetical protein
MPPARPPFVVWKPSPVAGKSIAAADATVAARLGLCLCVKLFTEKNA